MIQGLDRSPMTKVFRRIEEILKADGPLSRVVQSWQTYTARDGTNAAQPAQGRTAITLFPHWSGEDQWESTATSKPWLVVGVGLSLNTSDAGDPFDFWYAVMRALYPPDRDARFAIEKALRDEGAESGQMFFSAPRVSPDDIGERRRIQGVDAVGMVRLRVRLTLNP